MIQRDRVKTRVRTRVQSKSKYTPGWFFIMRYSRLAFSLSDPPWQKRTPLCLARRQRPLRIPPGSSVIHKWSGSSSTRTTKNTRRRNPMTLKSTSRSISNPLASPSYSSESHVLIFLPTLLTFARYSTSFELLLDAIGLFCAMIAGASLVFLLHLVAPPCLIHV